MPLLATMQLINTQVCRTAAQKEKVRAMREHTSALAGTHSMGRKQQGNLQFFLFMQTSPAQQGHIEKRRIWSGLGRVPSENSRWPQTGSGVKGFGMIGVCRAKEIHAKVITYESKNRRHLSLFHVTSRLASVNLKTLKHGREHCILGRLLAKRCRYLGKFQLN